MSRIFEALQKSEAVRSGGNFANSPLADEILEAAEKDAGESNGNGVNHLEQTAAVNHGGGQKASVYPEISPAAGERAEGFITLPLTLPPDSPLVSITQKESLAAEKFRYLGVKLRQMQSARGLKKILISSTLPEEGKSMVSANLAATLARRQQQKVLLIEGDMRRPVQVQRLGHIWLEGLAEWLAEPPIGLPPIYQLEGTGVCLLPAGSPPENPLELMQPDRLQAMLSRLEQQFDWIIIDSPPLLPLADTSVWARLADGVILVVREGKSERKYLQRGLAAVTASSLLAVVVNSCSNTDNKNYYSRYSATAGPLVE